jgi:hypothetical protein
MDYTFQTSSGVELQLQPVPRKLALSLTGPINATQDLVGEDQAIALYTIMAKMVDASVILELSEDQIAIARLARVAFEQAHPGMGAKKSDKFLYVQTLLPEGPQLWALIKEIMRISPPGPPNTASKPNKPFDPLAAFKRSGKKKK